MIPTIRREYRKLRHRIVHIAVDTRIRIEHRKSSQRIIVVNEIRRPIRICKILVEMTVMEISVLVHRIIVEIRHFIKIFLIDVPKQISVFIQNLLQSYHRASTPCHVFHLTLILFVLPSPAIFSITPLTIISSTVFVSLAVIPLYPIASASSVIVRGSSFNISTILFS